MACTAKYGHTLAEREVWIRDAYACANPQHRLTIRIVNETPWANLFCYNLFLRPDAKNVYCQ
jgi:phosphoenolpyruvate carboxykinase (ATP)